MPSNGIEVLRSSSCPPELLELAECSGAYSRFLLDDRLPNGSFSRLYQTWIKLSVLGELADSVYIHPDKATIDGMATVSWCQHGTAKIGLIAVKPAQRSCGIGSQLLQRIESDALKRGLGAIDVATQGANVGACAFYRRNGFVESKRQHIYHLWMKQSIVMTSDTGSDQVSGQ